jgi:MFS family permease
MADMFRVEQRGAAMAVWSLGPLLGPVIGPVAGGYLSAAKGWRWVFWVITMVVSFSFFPHISIILLTMIGRRRNRSHVRLPPRDIRSKNS